MKEGAIELRVQLRERISKDVPVFYNPAMKLNRDVTIAFLKAQGRDLACADVLAGSGIRALRIAKECGLRVHANDASPSAARSIRRHAGLNDVQVGVSNKGASRFLLESSGFDYIDIDPFGSPNPFLDAAIKRLSRDGFLGVTATDTSALAGSHVRAGVRKYWGRPVRNYMMHETGVRLLIRKIQLIGAQYGKALVPVFCHANQHYYRVYVQCEKGKARVDELFKQHKYVHFCCFEVAVDASNVRQCPQCKKQMLAAGPVWTGSLWDTSLVKKMRKFALGEAARLLDQIGQESRVVTVGFYEYYRMCSFLRRSVPPIDELLDKLRMHGFLAERTHFSKKSIRMTATAQQLLEFLSQ